MSPTHPRVILGTLGFGTFVDRQTAWRVLDAFWDFGGRCVDLAWSYGGGNARAIVAAYSSRRSRALQIWDKVGLKYEATHDGRGHAVVDYGTASASISTLRSFIELYGYPIDCLQFHAPIPDSQLKRVLAFSREALDVGLVRNFGVCNHTANEVIRLSSILNDIGVRITTSQVHMNIMEQRAVSELLPTHASLGIGTWANRIFARGAIVGDDGTSSRRQSSARLRDFVQAEKLAIRQLRTVLSEFADLDVSRVIVAWPLAQPSVQGIVVGSSSADQISQIMEAVNDPLDQSLIEEVTRRLQSDDLLNVSQRPNDLFDRQY